jgi:TIR domain-containing protein
MAMADVLLQLDTPASPTCLLVSGLPLEESTRVTIVHAPNAQPATISDAAELFDALRSELVRWGGQMSNPACGGRYRGTGQCMADTLAPRQHNLLVVVEDPNYAVPPALVTAFTRFPSHCILPLARRGTRAAPSAVILRNLMLQYPAGAVATVTPDVLEQARIGIDAFRLFISYKHDECAASASDIFHRLAEERFSVFLDRFCGAPGQDFVGRIMSELYDKSCVLVLETSGTPSSPWVQTEVATARTNRLGLLAVDLPGSLRRLSVNHRLDCTLANAGVPLGRAGRLGGGELDRIADFVRASVAREGARRRRWQRRTLRLAVRRSGATDHGATPLGRRIAAVRPPNTVYELALSARPPGVSTFIRIARAVAATKGGYPMAVRI